MPLARRDLNSGNHAQRVIALRQQVSNALRPLNVVMVGDGNQVKAARDSYFDNFRGTGPAVAQVRMHVEIGAAICDRLGKRLRT